MSKSFRRSDEDSFKSAYRPRARKVRDEEELMLGSEATTVDDLDRYEAEIQRLQATIKD